jgi:hypothetical protein
MGQTMTVEEMKAAQKWFENLTDEEVKQLVVTPYRNHLKHVEELKALGFKWGVER